VKCIEPYAYICTHTNMYIYMRMHVYSSIYRTTHTHTHTHTQGNSMFFIGEGSLSVLLGPPTVDSNGLLTSSASVASNNNTQRGSSFNEYRR
jgi:hypothetical protein